MVHVSLHISMPEVALSTVSAGQQFVLKHKYTDVV